VAEDSDSLMDTIDYAKLYGSIKKQMAEKSHLLEHLAKRIILAVQTEFPAISVIELKIAKINPPLSGKIQQVSFETSWKK
jgi:dihydroneopterin aldolase